MILCKISKTKIMGITLIILVLLTGCTKESSLRMEFHGTDSGRNSDIGNYISATSADFITSEICAIEWEDSHMEDDNLPATAAFMVDITKNEMMFAKNIYDRIYPASITKLMTALLILKYGDLSSVTVVTTDNAGITVPGAKLCGFKEGDLVSLDTLLNCLLVYSGNDACIIAAECLFGSEAAFVQKMNEEAKLIGATNTNFMNSHGLHDVNHYTTTYDTYLIFMECLKYENFIPIINQLSYRAAYENKEGIIMDKYFETTNMFLLKTMEAPDGVIVFGGKTGSTGDAGDCLILLSEKADSTKYITAVFKASSKNSLYSQIAYLLEKK